MIQRRSTGSRAEMVTVEQVSELADRLEDALLRLRELEERMEVVEQRRMDRVEATRRARIGRAARRAGFETAEAWEKHCQRLGWTDPTSQIPDDFQPARKRKRATSAR